MTFTRLNWGHTLAFVAALALLLAMAPVWWTDKIGEQDRFFQHNAAPQLNTQTEPSVSNQAAQAARTHEKNAWQAPAAIDRILLVALIASAALAIAAAFARAAGRDVGPPSLSVLATAAGLVASVLLAYRILQPPGDNFAAVVKWGAPVGLVCVGLVAIGSRVATLREREPQPEPEPEAAPDDAAETPAAPAGAG
ncbi:MAG: hypothetical protein QOF37_64 [Thermoleophilaceae bacterium]|nr:hypothetical protein [Thermoleophilaceae bacterium]